MYIIHRSADYWNRFYPGTQAQIIVNDNRTRQFKQGQYFIDDVQFFNNDDTVIKVSNPSPDTKYLVTDCTFINSHTSGDGADIQFRGDNVGGSFVEYHICSIGAQTRITEAHSLISTNNHENNIYKNWILESSISNCQGSGSTITKSSGSQTISNVNISYGNFNTNSLYIIGSISVTDYVNFSTFAYTNSSGLDCAVHRHNDQSVNHCNFIRNQLGDVTPIGLILFSGTSISFSFCVLAENKCNYLFYSKSKIIIEKCYISHTNSYEAICTANATITNKANNDVCLSHFANDYCEAGVGFYDIPPNPFAYGYRDKTIVITRNICSLTYFFHFFTTEK